MPEFLGDGTPISTQDNYVPALTLGPAARVAQISLSVIASNPALIQCWRYLDPDRTKTQLELVERTIVGQSIGVVLRNCAGVQIRSAQAGAPTTVVGELAYDTDVILEGGGVTSASISVTGKTSTATQVNVQHNDSLVAAEGTLDFEDAGANAWDVVDDAPNTRVKITPPRVITGIVDAAGAVSEGSGFGVVRNSAGVYTVTFATAFAVAPCVSPICLNTSTGFTQVWNALPTATGFSVQWFSNATGIQTDTAWSFFAFATG